MIRRMEESDILQVSEIEKACFNEPWSASLLKNTLLSALDICFIWEENGTVIGYSNMRTPPGEGEIERIAVLPESRGHGIGKKLMDAMVETSRQCDALCLWLEVREGNIPARKLYKSYGFKETAVRKAYYHSPVEDAIIMSRQNI